MKQFFSLELPSDLNHFTDYQELYEQHYLVRIMIIGLPVCALFCLYNIAASRPVESVASLFMCGVICLFLRDLSGGDRRRASEKRILYSRLFLVVFMAYLIYTVGVTRDLSKTPFLMIFPTFMFFSSRPREKLLWIGGGALLLAYFAYATDLTPSATDLIGFKARLLIVYAVIAGIGISTSVVVNGTIQNLFNSQKALREKNRELEREVEDRRIAQRALITSEEKYRELVENLNDAIYAMDAQGILTYVSPPIEAIIGYRPGEIIGRSFVEFIHPDDLERVMGEFEDLKRNRLYPSEYRVKSKSGKYKWIRSFSRPVPGSSDLQGLIMDVHDQKKVAAEKKALENQLIQSQKLQAVGTLAGGVAHDFNNILSPIIGHSDILLLQMEKEDPSRQSIEDIRKSAMRAKELVRQILTFSRPGKGEVRQVSFLPILKEAVQMLRSTIPASVEIHLAADPDCGTIRADPTHLHQLVMNTLTNAFHALEDSTGEIRVRLSGAVLEGPDLPRPRMAPGKYAVLSVRDTGVGMDEATQQQIFDPFFTTGKKGEGTGLGLSVVHGIVRSLNGSVTVVSAPGKGTEFIFHLPVFQGKTADTGDEKANILTGSGHILFVDDEPAMVDMTRKVLETLGYQVAAFTDPEAALNAFKSDPRSFDLVITDMTMPKMTGAGLAEQMLWVRPDIPVIVCTGYSAALEGVSAGEIGITEIVMKPATVAKLSTAIHRALAGNGPGTGTGTGTQA